MRATALEMSRGNCCDSQGHRGNSGAVAMSVQVSPAVTPGGAAGFRAALLELKYTAVIDRERPSNGEEEFLFQNDACIKKLYDVVIILITTHS